MKKHQKHKKTNWTN